MYIGLKHLSNQEDAHTEARSLLSFLAGDGEIRRGWQGRPYFTDRRGDFSVSHSGNAACAAYSAARSARTGALLRVGCDIEMIHPRKDRYPVARRFFRPAERRYLRDAPDPVARRLRFYSLWTLKECFLKAAGQSVFAMKSVPSFVSDSGELRGQAASPALSVCAYLYELEDPRKNRYALAVAREVEGPAPCCPARLLYGPAFFPIFKGL